MTFVHPWEVQIIALLWRSQCPIQSEGQMGFWHDAPEQRCSQLRRSREREVRPPIPRETLSGPVQSVEKWAHMGSSVNFRGLLS